MSASIEGIQPATSVLKAAYATPLRGAGAAHTAVSRAPAAAAEFLRRDSEPAAPDVGRTVDDVNDQMARDNRSVRFKFDEEANRVQIQIVDAERERVIRSMPSDEMLSLATRMRELSGLGAMVDQSR